MVEQDQKRVEICQKAGLVSICRTLYKLQASPAKKVFVLGRSIAIGVPTSRWRTGDSSRFRQIFLTGKAPRKLKKTLVILGSLLSELHLQSPTRAHRRSFVKPGGIFRETETAKRQTKTYIHLYYLVFEARFHVPG